MANTTVIKIVMGNVLRLNIPLQVKIRNTEQGEPTEKTEDFYPSLNYPTIVKLTSDYKTVNLDAEVEGNVVKVEDKGTLKTGCYQIEVICKDDNANPYRFAAPCVIHVVNYTKDADIEAGIEFNSETYTLEGAYFIQGEKGDKGDPFTWEDFTEEEILLLQKPAQDKADEVTELQEQWTEAETQRSEAETRRQEAEQGRERAEGTRQTTFETNERQRQTTFSQNEQQRQNTFEQNEQGRQEAERQRSFNESQRQEAERQRVAAERGRVNAEEQRSTAEGQRNTSEQQRQNNEQARSEAETARERAENKRQQDTHTAINNANTATQNANTKAEQAEQAATLAQEVAGHPNIVGANGNWLQWDATNDEYVDTGVKALNVVAYNVDGTTGELLMSVVDGIDYPNMSVVEGNLMLTLNE